MAKRLCGQGHMAGQHEAHAATTLVVFMQDSLYH
jgi:hypothetical protein